MVTVGVRAGNGKIDSVQRDVDSLLVRYANDPDGMVVRVKWE